MTFANYMTASIKFRNDIFKYISELDYETSHNVIKGVKEALNAFDSEAETNEEFRVNAFNYYRQGGTFVLFELLRNVGIGWDDLLDYNVMTTIDSFSAEHVIQHKNKFTTTR